MENHHGPEEVFANNRFYRLKISGGAFTGEQIQALLGSPGIDHTIGQTQPDELILTQHNVTGSLITRQDIARALGEVIIDFQKLDENPFKRKDTPKG